MVKGGIFHVFCAAVPPEPGHMTVYIFHVGGLVEKVFRGVRLRVLSAYITSKALIYRPASTGALHQKRQQRLDD